MAVLIYMADLEALCSQLRGLREGTVHVVDAQADPRFDAEGDEYVSITHSADCDHEYDVRRTTALLHISLAEESIQLMQDLRKVDDPSYRVFLRLMVGGVKIAKARRAA